MTDYFHLNIDRDALLSLSTLGLAHLGDGVYEVMVRSWLVLHGKAKAKDLHRATVRYVAAPAQAERFEKIQPLLAEEEADVFRRGRNTAPHSIPVWLAVPSGEDGAAERAICDHDGGISHAFRRVMPVRRDP